MSCANCGAVADLVEHHKSYNPDETVFLCRGCHSSVHQSPEAYPELAPDHVPIDRRRNEGNRFLRMTRDTQIALLCIFGNMDVPDVEEGFRELMREAGYDPEELVTQYTAIKIGEKMDPDG